MADGADGAARGTLPRLFAEAAAARPEAVVLGRRSAEAPGATSFGELLADARALAAGLVDLRLPAGARVGLFLDNGKAWLLADLAIQEAGLVAVPRGEDTPPAELERILAHAQAAALMHTGPAAPCELPPGCRALPIPDRTGDGRWPLLERGRALLATAAGRERLARRRAALRPEDPAVLIYTSGTTGSPKGVVLTHRNLRANIAQCLAALGLRPGERYLSVLPSWHAFERILEYAVFAAGGEIVYTSPRRLARDLEQQKPEIVAFVPRIWEMIAAGLEARLAELPKSGRLLVGLLRRLGPRLAGGPLAPLHRGLARHLLAPLHRRLGGRLRLAISGGGTLPLDVDRLLVGLGVPLLNGYGLTETSPVVSVRRPRRNRPGTVGPPLPDTEVRIADPAGRSLPPGAKGEVLVRGPQVTPGYHAARAATAAVLDAEGWFHTGDLGSLDRHGELRILGRLKDTIVLAGGENVEPEPIEAALRTSPWIDQVLVVGQDRKQLGALIVPPPERLGEEGPDSAALRRALRAELDRILCRERGFRPVERIGPFAILDEGFTQENGLLTATLKLRRREALERHRERIEALYAGGGRLTASGARA